jgi:tRNA uridine 5-carboxymethylaminomethyl modification enzyme
LLSNNRIVNVEAKAERIAHWLHFFDNHRQDGQLWSDRIRREGQGISLPDDFKRESSAIREEVMYRVIYKGYIDREERQIEKLGHIEKIRIPAGMDFLAVRGLRRESALKLAELKPYTLGQASRISGVNPADISVLMVLIEAGRGAGG